MAGNDLFGPEIPELVRRVEAELNFGTGYVESDVRGGGAPVAAVGITRDRYNRALKGTVPVEEEGKVSADDISKVSGKYRDDVAAYLQQLRGWVRISTYQGWEAHDSALQGHITDIAEAPGQQVYRAGRKADTAREMADYRVAYPDPVSPDEVVEAMVAATNPDQSKELRREIVDALGANDPAWIAAARIAGQNYLGQGDRPTNPVPGRSAYETAPTRNKGNGRAR